MILPREFQGGLDRLRTTTCEPYPVERARRHIGNDRRQLFGCFGREESGVNVFEARRLVRHRRNDSTVTVTEARHGGSAAPIDIAVPAVIDQEYPFSPNSNRWPGRRRPVENVFGGHYGTVTVVAAASTLLLFSLGGERALSKALEGACEQQLLFSQRQS